MFRTRYACLVLVSACLLSGCGTTKSRLATEQLLVSDAVDRSVARIDFGDLSGKKVYLDTQYLKAIKGTGFVNADYIVSSLRQQMMAARCYLEETRDTADYIAEVRVGALGTDAHDVTYGIPPSNSLSNAASLVPNAPAIPMIPEIALAKKADEAGSAKIVVFAYNRETREPYWQSGIAQAKSTAKDMWLFGAGPFQSGTIHDGIQLAGEDLEIPLLAGNLEKEMAERLEEYSHKKTFGPLKQLKTDPELLPNAIRTASHSEEAIVLETPPATTPPPEAPAPPENPAPPETPVAETPAAETPAPETPANPAAEAAPVVPPEAAAPAAETSPATPAPQPPAGE